MDPQDLKGIPTGDGGWLKRVCKEFGNQHDPAPPIMNLWYQSAVKEIEKLEDAVQTLMNQNNTLIDGIKVLKDQATDYSKEVADLNAKLLFPSWGDLKPTREEMEAEVKKLKEEVRVAKEREGVAFTDQDSLRDHCTQQEELIASLKGGKIEELEAAVQREKDHSKAMLKQFNDAAEEIADLKVKLTNAKTNGENEKVYLRGRIKVLLHQVSSLSGVLADVSGKHAERINTGIPTPVHLMNR